MKGQQSHHIKLQEQENNNNNNNNFTNSTPQIDSSTPNFPNYPHHPTFLSTPPHLLPTNQSQNPQNTPVQIPQNTPAKRPKITPTTSSEDNSTIDSTRKPTGRPRGSKNRPKSPIIITQQPEPGLKPYIIELPSGSDIVTRLTRQRGISLCIISATGAVGDVTLMQTSTSVPGGTVLFRGKFDILSLSACLLVDNSTGFDRGFNGVFSITLSGPHGQIVGGKVVGPLVSVGVVYVVATSFSDPEYNKLPMQVGNQSDGNGDGDADCKLEIGGGYLNKRGSSGDVVWTPAPLAARPPQPPLN